MNIVKFFKSAYFEERLPMAAPVLCAKKSVYVEKTRFNFKALISKATDTSSLHGWSSLSFVNRWGV